jgi:inosine-uridine nucleoside N-ribohydrolase
VVTGALTNLAIMLRAFPDIRTRLKGITLMGGAIGMGNWSPAAEFNILVDP